MGESYFAIYDKGRSHATVSGTGIPIVVALGPHSRDHRRIGRKRNRGSKGAYMLCDDREPESPRSSQ